MLKLKTYSQTSPKSIKAQDIMCWPLVALHTNDTVRQAAAVLLDKRISGAPVLDNNHQPVGVITKTDIVRYEREYVAAHANEEVRKTMLAADTLETIAEGRGFHRESEEDYLLHWMTPRIYTVNSQDNLLTVVREMAKKRIHRIFVQEKNSKKLVGVVTTFDLLWLMARLFRVSPARR